MVHWQPQNRVHKNFGFQVEHPNLKFTCSEKTSKFCEICTLPLSYVVPVKSKVEIVTISEYMNFILFSFLHFSHRFYSKCYTWFTLMTLERQSLVRRFLGRFPCKLHCTYQSQNCFLTKPSLYFCFEYLSCTFKPCIVRILLWSNNFTTVFDSAYNPCPMTFTL